MLGHLGIPVERPEVLDASAQGAAFAAGLVVGLDSGRIILP
ncbi:MAG TPA: hypothetical protein V6D14_02420 [Coleofasciculaceae cyanobacterium]